MAVEDRSWSSADVKLSMVLFIGQGLHAIFAYKPACFAVEDLPSL